MSQNNTNRDIRRFETDADGNTTRVLLNTDEPLGLLDGDYQERLGELENRLNAITGGAYSNTVQIAHGGTGAENAQVAFDNLISSLNSSLAAMTPYFIVKRNADGAGAAISVDDAVQALGALKASNNLSDLQNALTSLQNLYHNVPIAEPQGGIPLKAWFDGIYVMLGRIVGTGGDNYYIEPNRYTLKDLVDNYLSEYFTKKSNDLSDLDSISNAVSNLIDGLSVAGIPVINRNVELMAKQPGFPSGTGKITLEDIFDNYLLSAFNTEYGMTRDAQTNTYEFDGNSVSANTAKTALGLSMAGGSVNMALRVTASQLYHMQTGTTTILFTSTNGDFGVNDTILGFRIVADDACDVYINSFTQQRVKTDYPSEINSLVASVDITVNSVPTSQVPSGASSDFYIYCYYLHNLNN